MKKISLSPRLLLSMVLVLAAFSTQVQAIATLESPRWRVALDPATPSAGPAVPASDGVGRHRVFASVLADDVQPISLAASFGEFIVNPETPAVSMRPAGASDIPLAAAAFSAAKASDQSGHRWRIDSGSYHFTVIANIDNDALRLSISSDQPADPTAINAYAMPFGEGSYAPADDPAWLDWLRRRYETSSINELLSMPFRTELRADRSVTWIVETPFNNNLKSMS